MPTILDPLLKEFVESLGGSVGFVSDPDEWPGEVLNVLNAAGAWEAFYGVWSNNLFTGYGMRNYEAGTGNEFYVVAVNNKGTVLHGFISRDDSGQWIRDDFPSPGLQSC